MFYSKIQFKKVSLLFYVLSLLLACYLYFNLRYNWFGFSLIVRVYLYVFCFYMIYIYNISGQQLSERLLPDYLSAYGKKGKLLLAFERRVFPFIIIILITLAYTLIDYIREGNWPWNPLMLLLGGRYSNLVSYSLILYFILNIRKKPIFAIPIFIVISLVYFFGDTMIYDTFPIGPVVSGYRILKFSAVAFVLLFDDPYDLKKIFRKGILAAGIGIISYALLTGIYLASYKLSDNSYYIHKRSGFNLAKMGYSFPIKPLQKMAVENNDVTSLQDLYRYSFYYKINPDYTDSQWSSLLFSQNSQKAEEVASYMFLFGKTLPFHNLIVYVSNRLAVGDQNILSAEFYISLCANSITGHEREFIAKIPSDINMTIWGIKVLGRNGSPVSIPFLIRMLTNLNDTISAEAYIVLKTISGLDPVQDSPGGKINTPETIQTFKEFYLSKNIIR